MSLRFELMHTGMDPLWDFGWFDLSRFRVEGAAFARQDSRHVLEAFLKDPISQRSFCSPGPWGEAIGHHGPFLSEKLVAGWFRPIGCTESAEGVIRALEDRFTEPPSSEQRLPVNRWLESVQARGDSVYVLDAPAEPEGRLDWHWVWLAYNEFVCVSPASEELTVAVVGYD